MSQHVDQAYTKILTKLHGNLGKYGVHKNYKCLKQPNRFMLRKMALPSPVMVSKVTVKSGKYTNILMGTVQAAIANGVLDAVRSGDIPEIRLTTWGSSIRSGSTRRCSRPTTWTTVLFDVHRAATAKAIRKAMHREPTIDWLLENQDKMVTTSTTWGSRGIPRR